MLDFWDLIGKYFPYILNGAFVTVKITAISLVLSILFGFLLAFMKISSIRTLRIIASVYIEIIRAAPVLLQLFIVYFGLTSFGIRLQPFWAAVLTFGFIGAAYAAEVFRSGIEAVDRGQYEASRSLGMSHALAMRRVIVPQAFALILPPFTNFVISLIKDTSLALTIAVPEIMYRSYDAASQSFRSMEIYAMAGVLYLAICLPLSQLATALERKARRK